MIDTFNGKADIGQINKWYALAKREHQDYRNRARKAMQFYFGSQWESSTVESLNRQKRPALTINKVKPIIRTLSGYMRQNRKDLRVAARRGGVDAVASIYTKVIKYIYDYSYADWFNAMAFTDGIIGGKGWVSVDRNFENDPITGDLIITREDPFLIYEDPYAQRYDMGDARFVFRGRWMDMAQITAMFPKAKEFATAFLSGEGNNATGVEAEYAVDDNEGDGIFALSENRFFVKECWYKSFEKKRFLSIEGQEPVDIGSNISEEEVSGILTQYAGAKVITRVMPQMRMAITLGDIILHEEDDPMSGSVRFPIIRFCNEMITAGRPYIRGEVDDLIGAQEEHNKRRSQSLHLLNTSANSGFIVEEGAMDPTELRKLESEGSKPGFVAVVKQGGINRLQKLTPSPVSEGHLTLSNMSDSDMKAISGVNADLLGLDKSSASSGIAMEMRRRQGLINCEPTFDNYDFMQRVLGDTLLDYIRVSGVYTPQEIADICGGSLKMVDGRQLNAEQIAAFMMTKKGAYSVAMSDMTNNPTIRQAEFMQMIQAIKEVGIQVPPQMIVENSDWAFKDQLLAEMEKAQQQAIPQQGAPAPEGVPVQMTPQLEQEFAARLAAEQGQAQ